MAVKIKTWKCSVVLSTVIPTLFESRALYSIEDIIALLAQEGIDFNKKELEVALLKLIREGVLSFVTDTFTIQDVTIDSREAEDISIHMIYFKMAATDK